MRTLAEVAACSSSVMIHAFRLLGRLAGPRWSALCGLGLPSTTAIVLVICGCQRGIAGATAMAGSSLPAWPRRWRCRWPMPRPYAWADGASRYRSRGERIPGRRLDARLNARSRNRSVAGHRGLRHRVGRFVGATAADPEENHAGIMVLPVQAMAVTQPSRRPMCSCRDHRAHRRPAWAGAWSARSRACRLWCGRDHLKPGPPRPAGSPGCCRWVTPAHSPFWRRF